MFSSGFVNLGKSEKQRKLWPIFLKKKSKCWKRKEKEIFLTLRFRIIFKRYVKNCKGAPRILIYGFKEKFLYPLECWEVPSGS